MTDSTTIEKIILENLLTDSEYCRKALPFLTEEYFDSKIEKVIFGEINRFHSEHNTAPNKKILKIFLDDYTKFKQEEYELANELIESFSDTSENMDWLYQRTEKFCKDKSLFNAITTSIQIMDGSNTKFGKDAIPAILSEALAISFDKTIGHDYWSDIERRYDFYHAKLDRIPFHLDMFNKITFGGLPKKTLSAILAPTGVGKSLFLCDYSANALLQGYNVLYITLEMAEEKIAERIDCNIMDVKIQELQRMGKKDFDTKLERLKSKTKGQLVIKEYPTSSAHAGHFKALLDDLRIKKGFVPDIICVDYLNICASQRYKGGSNYNSYFAVKATAEELRGVAVEYNVAMITATQSNKCLTLDTLVTTDKGNVPISSLSVGDEILSHSGYVTVKNIFPIETQDVYEITTKSGKVVRCSGNHIWPTETGMKCINSGLAIGDSVFSLRHR